jgi:CDP-diacylglycerol---serine O-phosphatidyltransferase
LPTSCFLTLFASMNRFVLWIPNTLTLANLACGFLAILCWQAEQTAMMVYLIAIGAVLDFMDGAAAKLLNAKSSIGKELDSLADMVTFGLVPGVISYFLISETLPNIPTALLILISLITPICAAIRLAYFNSDESSVPFFKGMPTPANTLFWAALLWAYLSESQPPFGSMWIYIAALSILSITQIAFFLPILSLKSPSYFLGIILFAGAGSILWAFAGGWSAPILALLLILISQFFVRKYL